MNKVVEKEKKPALEDGTELFKEALPSDSEIAEVVIDKLVALGDTRDEAEAKLVKWNRSHGI